MLVRTEGNPSKTPRLNWVKRDQNDGSPTQVKIARQNTREDEAI